MTERDNIRVNVFIAIVDSIFTSLETRIEAYEEICNLFGFLADFKTLEKKLIEAAKKLITAYPIDLENQFESEMIFLPF